MLAETAAAVGSLKTLYDLAKGLQAMKTDAEIKMATAEMLNTVISVRQQVFEAQEAEATLLKRIDGLEQEIVRLKTWDREDERYELKRYFPGTYAYELKPEMARGEPPQRLCQPCYDKRQKGVLASDGNIGRGYPHFRCPICKDSIAFGNEMPLDAEF
jgi:hypothetical protein